MKTELFEKLIRKIVREELEFYTSKVINEIGSLSSKTLFAENNNKSVTNSLPKKQGLSESLLNFKQQLDAEYSENSKVSFDGMEVPPELDQIFNRDYTDFLNKMKR